MAVTSYRIQLPVATISLSSGLSVVVNLMQKLHYEHQKVKEKGERLYDRYEYREFEKRHNGGLAYALLLRRATFFCFY